MSARDEALRIAVTQVGVRETSRNSGPEVDAYLSSVGQPPGRPWCAAFVHWCFDVGAASVNLGNPCPHTAGALRLWALSPAKAQHEEPEPGDVFVIDHGHGLGHVGFVLAVGPTGHLDTIEGNTAPNGAREGDGVYQRTRQRDEINRGFLRL